MRHDFSLLVQSDMKMLHTMNIVILRGGTIAEISQGVRILIRYQALVLSTENARIFKIAFQGRTGG